MHRNKYLFRAWFYLVFFTWANNGPVFGNDTKNDIQSAEASEQSKWDAQKEKAEQALDFWIAFLNMQEGPSNNIPLTKSYRDHWLCLIRAVSWVESKHGTVGANQPGRDPMQAGNPADSWWKSLTHQSGDSDRFIGGPTRNNWWGHELPVAAAKVEGFPDDAKITKLGNRVSGHRDEKFNATMSYYWGVIYLIQRVNTRLADGKTYKCGVYSKTYLIDGAVKYNGGGDPNYKSKLEEALMVIGCTLP
jgi:hypothetical protein